MSPVVEASGPDDVSLDFRPYDSPHGTEGHVGAYCGQCGALASVVIQLGPTGGDHWQSVQIAWQEQCDTIFRDFDNAVADHFPEHLPQNCDGCPDASQWKLPEKPIQPIERSIAQNARNDD